jgi:hypothetical protein
MTIGPMLPWQAVHADGVLAGIRPEPVVAAGDEPIVSDTSRFAEVLTQRRQLGQSLRENSVPVSDVAKAPAEPAVNALSGKVVGRTLAVPRDPANGARTNDTKMPAAKDAATPVLPDPVIVPTVRFIDGSLFGHSSALPAADVTPAQAGGAGVSVAANQVSSAMGTAAQVSRAPGPAAVEPQPVRVDMVVVPKTTSDAAGGLAAVGGQTIVDEQPVDPDVAAVSLVAAPTSSGVTAEPLAPIAADESDPEPVVIEEPEPAQTPAPVAADQGDREAQVVNLAQVHVVAAMASDGPGLRIAARVSGLSASDEDLVGSSLLTASLLAGGARLRLNGIDRSEPARN